MRKLIFVLILVPAVLFSQQRVQTENANNKYYHLSAATAGDTLYSAGTLNVLSIYLDKIVLNTCVNSDSVIIKDGAGTVAQIILGASAPAYPISVSYGIRLDTSFIIIQKKTSDVTYVFRTNY